MRFSYSGIEVKNMDESIKFYTELLGMKLLDRHGIPESGGEVAALKSEGSDQLLELNWYPKSEYREGSELDHLAFEADDAGAEVERLKGLGITEARPLEVRAKYVVGFVKDPNGIWLEIYNPRK